MSNYASSGSKYIRTTDYTEQVAVPMSNGQGVVYETRPCTSGKGGKKEKKDE